MNRERQTVPAAFGEAIDDLSGSPLLEWLGLPDNLKKHLPRLTYKAGVLLLPRSLYEIDDLVDQPMLSISRLAHKLDIAERILLNGKKRVLWPKKYLKLAASFAVLDFSMEGLLVDRGGNVRIPPLGEGSVFYFHPGSEALACAHELLACLGEAAGFDGDLIDWYRRNAFQLRSEPS